MKKEQNDSQHELTMNELLSAISDTEYPQYILDALQCVQGWLNETVSAPAERGLDSFSAIFEGDGPFRDAEETDPIGTLFERLEPLEEFADIIPNTRKPEGREDVIVVSLTPPDYDSGLRTAIDYAAVFNKNCRRVWIISDTFIFDDVMRYSAHVDAMAAQGVTLRFLLVTPWGWVELPLSGISASKRQFMWTAPGESAFTQASKQSRGKH